MISTAELRQKFLDFFQNKNHEIVASSSLVPGNDPTLLFTNAGMVQFKDVFLGMDKRAYVRATSSQRCVRAGGKHNDLENVGYTARHHTFFEMLGNFSFGDYFKEEAIHYAWEFLTKVLQLPAERLWVTVFEKDDEAADIWLNQIGVDKNRFSRIGAKDNFWQMGDTGPCGPCTEIFYDHGEHIWGGPPGTPEEDGDRYIEIWNLVFMQYDRSQDGTLTALPKPSVDTGMGLERIAAIMQKGHSNYDIDLFQHLLKFIARLADTNDLKNASLKVIADHIRSCAFLITDGVLPSNEGRGYVLRRIIRRAARHGHKLGLKEAFFYKIVQPLVDEMGIAYPELTQAQAKVEKILLQEEQRFSETLHSGMKILENELNHLKGKILAGNIVFKLYDTYGFPIDLTADILRERDLKVDQAGFDKAMQAQRERARSAGKFAVNYDEKLAVSGQTDFVGYQQTQSDAKIIALFKDGQAVDGLKAGETGQLILDNTPFYAESGGQIGDTGQIGNFQVTDTQKQGEVFIHHGKVTQDDVKIHLKVIPKVDQQRRQSIILNHSATHLMHAALRDILGKHVEQKGSLVNEKRLRFDFSHFEPITSTQLAEVETRVNHEIQTNVVAHANIMSMDAAKEQGAMALFGEKYGDDVRVVEIGSSTELCGGVHVKRSGDIGFFKIISESGIAAGVRRIEAVTGQNALAWISDQDKKLNFISQLLKTNTKNVDGKVQALVEKNRQLEKTLEQLKAKLAAKAGSDLSSQAIEINGIKLLATQLKNADPKSLRQTVDQLKNKLGKGIIVLATVKEQKISLIAGITKAETQYIKAGELINFVAKQVGGRGGGRPDMAMAGGNQPENLDKALHSVQNWLKNKL